MRLLREAARTGNLEVIKEVIQRLRDLKRTVRCPFTLT